jgi:hypothetical protein
MSSWGKLDSKQLTGNLRVTNGSRVVANSLGNATIFLTEVKPGDYFVAGPVQGNTNVKYYVSNVISDVLLNLSTAYEGTTANVKANVQQGPKFVNVVENVRGNAYTIQKIYGVDSNEAGNTMNKANNVNQPGWIHQIVWTDGFGARRVRTETLVAMSKNFNRDDTANLSLSPTTGNLLTDADDDTVLRDTNA